MNTVLSLIIMISQNTLKNDTLNIISRYIIEHINELSDMTITSLAKNTYTSTTSIIRFCEMLGFDSYSVFKKNLLTGIKTRKLQLIEKYDEVVIDHYIQNMQTMALEEINKDDFIKKIRDCVDYIYENKKIHFYGAVFPLALTLSFMEDMIIMGIPVELHQMHYGEHHLINDDGLHFIITLTGRFMTFHKKEYKKLLSMGNKTILLSQEMNLKSLLMNIEVPRTMNYDYGELIILLILDMIKLEYYKKHM